jgi:hypothetical protein
MRELAPDDVPALLTFVASLVGALDADAREHRA